MNGPTRERSEPKLLFTRVVSVVVRSNAEHRMAGNFVRLCIVFDGMQTTPGTAGNCIMIGLERQR